MTHTNKIQANRQHAVNLKLIVNKRGSVKNKAAKKEQVLSYIRTLGGPAARKTRAHANFLVTNNYTAYELHYIQGYGSKAATIIQATINN